MKMLTVMTLLTAMVLSGCRRRTADLGMSDSAFVQVMGELKAVADAPQLSIPLKAQRRDAVLRKRGVTAERIEALGTELAAHPAHAKRLWAAIEQKAIELLQRPTTQP